MSVMDLARSFCVLLYLQLLECVVVSILTPTTMMLIADEVKDKDHKNGKAIIKSSTNIAPF